MTSEKTIGVLVGSIRKQSFSKAIADALVGLLQDRVHLRIPDIGSLPMYNQDDDDEGNPPEAWVRFRREIESMDGFLFVTPEYNRSVPPVLKNALDVASRPYGQNKWNAKPGAVISVSPGAMGGFGANHHLRQSLTFLNVAAMQQPEAYIGNVASLLDEGGKVKQDTLGFLGQVADAFYDWARSIWG